jgi:hypothetical protein
MGMRASESIGRDRTGPDRTGLVRRRTGRGALALPGPARPPPPQWRSEGMFRRQRRQQAWIGTGPLQCGDGTSESTGTASGPRTLARAAAASWWGPGGGGRRLDPGV